MKTYALLGAAALITSTASATFTSLTVETAFHAGTGCNVYSIFANFSGWYDSTPGSQNLAGATLKIKIMQIARLAAGETGYTGRLNVGYALFGTTTPLFSGNVTYTLPVPAPGALALLSLAGFSSRRRK